MNQSATFADDRWRAGKRGWHGQMVLKGSCFSGLAALLLWGSIVSASAQTSMPKQSLASNDPICLLIQSAAHANALPVNFFARLIWQESRFQPDEIGPVTRMGQRAQGIAQFMPGTAEGAICMSHLIPLRHYQNRANFLPNFAISSAIWTGCGCL